MILIISQIISDARKSLVMLHFTRILTDGILVEWIKIGYLFSLFADSQSVCGRFDQQRSLILEQYIANSLFDVLLSNLCSQIALILCSHIRSNILTIAEWIL
jgi:hypothetical protein